MIWMRYFSLSRILLLTVGLWPYERSKLIHLQLILVYGILISFIVFQFATFVTLRCTPQLIIEILSVTSMFICTLIKYNSFYFHMDIVKHIFELLHHIYDELRDEGEIAIIEKYLNIGRRYTEIFTLMAMSSLLSIIVAPFLPRILDIVLSANESRPYLTLYIVTEHFIDPERYLYLIILHVSAAYCIGIVAFIGPATMLIPYLHHVCGMLRIASYRVERAMEINIREMNGNNVNMIYKGIISAVDMHRKALKLLNTLVSTFNVTFFFLMVIGLLSASLNLFREISSGIIMEKLIQSIIGLSIYYIYTFIANDIAQQVIDHNKHVFATVYKVQWYLAPIRVQKLILILLQKGTKEFKIVIGGLFIASLEGFTTLVSTSVSYFTVLYSMRKERSNL